MIEAKKLREVYDFNRLKPVDGQATILYDQGVCAIDSTIEVSGLEIDFKGKAEITPTLPDGFILQGNSHKILIFTLENITLQKQELFQYKGEFEIIKIIAANHEGKRIRTARKVEKPDWVTQGWSLSAESKNWDTFTQTKNVGKVNKTKFNLPDYNLPKVNIKNKNKPKNRRLSYSGGSGSGGY